MSKEAEIQRYLQDREIGPAVVARFDDAVQTLFIEVSIGVIRDHADNESASRYQLTRLAHAIARRFSVRTALIYRPPAEFAEIEAQLRSKLAEKWASYVEDVYLSFATGKEAFAWITSKDPVTADVLSQIIKEVSDHLAAREIALSGSELVVADSEPPSQAAILRAVKALAPASIEQVIDHLEKREFSRPSERSVRNTLDSARKRGLVVWHEPGRYTLTSSGLDFVPHTRTRTSSDIERILLMARRREW